MENENSNNTPKKIEAIKAIGHLLIFRVCNKFIIKRDEILSFLQMHIEGLESLNIELEDSSFRMKIRSKSRNEFLIERLVLMKGLHISFVTSIPEYKN